MREKYESETDLGKAKQKMAEAVDKRSKNQVARTHDC
jgi:hypothetical protein